MALPLAGCGGSKTLTARETASSAAAPPVAALVPTPSPTAPASSTPPPTEPVTLSPVRAELVRKLDSLFASPEFESALWGARVETLDGEVLYDHNGAKLLVPASNLKIYTTAAALDLLGPDFTYTTRLEALGTIMPDGQLQGSLLITGSGDPSLGSWHLDGPENDSRVLLKQWADALRAAGVRSVQGDILGDGRVFTEQYFLNGWEIDDLPYWYAAGSSGLCIEENCFRFISAPGKRVGDPALLTFIPETKYIEIVNRSRTTAAGTDSDIDIVYRHPEGNTIRFERAIALDKEPFQQRGSVWDGARYTAFLLKETLEREGIVVSGDAKNIRSLDNPAAIDATPAEERHPIATYTSPPMSRIVAIINKPSHNFFADQVLRTIGYKKGSAGSFEAGARVVAEWLKTIGAPDTEHFQMLDGSGLARRNYIQPRQTCALLRHMYKTDTVRAAFYDSLPIAGVDGDLKKRMAAPPTIGNVHAKTGYIGNVRSLSGYVNDAQGNMLVFSFMVNQNFAGISKADIVIEGACRLLAEYSETGDGNTAGSK